MMSVPLIILALAAAPPPTQASVQGAMARETVSQEGFVRVRLDLEGDGRVIGCTVIESTAPAMNDTTCRVLLAEARFRAGTGTGADDRSRPIIKVVHRIMGDPSAPR